MNSEPNSVDLQQKADKAHWEDVWRGSEPVTAANPEIGGIRNLFVRRMDRLFRRILGGPCQGKSLLELGCGSSIWLPYFAKQFGLDVSGIDYSETGCRLAQNILAKEGVRGRVHQADFFNPNDDMLEKFDVVYSAGVAEHFQPTEKCISAFARYLVAGGTMITLVPNMTGVTGWFQMKLNRHVYDIHVPLTSEALKSAHEAAGLKVEECRYFLPTGFVVSTSGLEPTALPTIAKEQFLRLLRLSAAVTWLIEDMTLPLPETRLLSPFVVCVARKL